MRTALVEDPFALIEQMTVHIIDNGSRYQDELVKLLAAHQPSVIAYDEIDKATIGSDDIIVLSGGHGYPVLWHDKEYAREIDIIKTHPGPIIGVCLGAQLIAHAYGSRLHYLSHRSQGVKKITLTPEGREMFEDRAYTVYESHNWSAPKVSSPLVCLAASDDGVEIFKHITKPTYGMQFHPEQVEGQDGRGLFEEILANELVSQN